MVTIESIAQFRSHVGHKEEIRESNIGLGQTCFCYMIAGQDTFDSDWTRECRGITFNAAGHVTSRPLAKFFNVNERESTQVQNLDWSKVVRVMDKRDGSMLHSVITPAGIRLKSKKTFDSDVAKAAQKLMDSLPCVTHMVTNLAARNHTAIFEYTAPDARIVVHYPKAELQLLHARNNETGEYMSGTDLRAFAGKFGVKCVDETHEFTFEDPSVMLEAAKTREGIEGWVVQFENGDMVKLKTDWYLQRHRVMTFMRERDIAQLTLDEGLDDVKAMLVGEGVDLTEVLQIERRVVSKIAHIERELDATMMMDADLDRKTFALKHQGATYFGLLMAKYVGKEANVKLFFERNILKEEYTLRQLVLVPSVAEGE